MRKRVFFVALAAVAAACGGGDDGAGIDRDKPITELTGDEIVAFCEWAVDAQGGAGSEYECDGVTFTVPTVDECAQGVSAPDACSTVTYGELEACYEAFAADPCTGFGSPECAELIECSQG